ncbi:hypothetical protein [Streptomyces sp. NPDC007206]|uniref:hypothetical protein n=1 Tax=Streptomyces sp. NPDC007206 TaxID=3154317 RepID=UPI0033EAD581
MSSSWGSPRGWWTMERSWTDQIIPVDRASVDRDQIRKLTRAHITPAPRGVTVDWSDDQQGSFVLHIDVSAQDCGCLFVVAAPVGKPGTPRTDTVAVPAREADETHWLPRTEIQRLLAAGTAASGMPPAETLSQLRRLPGLPSPALSVRSESAPLLPSTRTTAGQGCWCAPTGVVDASVDVSSPHPDFFAGLSVYLDRCEGLVHPSRL